MFFIQWPTTITSSERLADLSKYVYTFSLHFSGILAAVIAGINSYIIYAIYSFDSDIIIVLSSNRTTNESSYDIPKYRILVIGI